MRKQIISVLLVMAMLISVMPAVPTMVDAASISSYEPYVNIETSYSPSVQCGTVRYISQTSGSSYFNSNYWGSWKSQADSECGTACISMSLSYIGVNKTPEAILDAGKGKTYFGWTWGDGVPKSFTATNLSTAINNYISGGGKYSPPIIHLNNYSSAGHFVAIIGKVSSNTYQVIDPGNSVVTWQITINGSSATYTHPRTGAIISDSIDRSGRSDDIYQYYNANVSRDVTVTFNANGGSCSTSTTTVSSGREIGTLPTPTRNGYEFVGWYPNQHTGENPITSSTTVSSNVTYYAHWTTERDPGYHIVFNANGGELPSEYASIAVSSENTFREQGYVVVYTCDGIAYHHNGWGNVIAVNSAGQIVEKREYTDTTPITVPAGGFLVSAHDESSACGTVGDAAVGEYVAYDKSSGTLLFYDSENAFISHQKYMSPDDTYHSLPVPVREGYVFDGWYPDMGSEITWDSTYFPGEAYARWVWNENVEPESSVSDPATGHLYERYDYIMTWEDAKAFCESRGGYLVTITSAQEQELIMDGLMSDSYRDQYYIGATDADQEGVWNWISGESFAYSNWNQKVPEPSGGTIENYSLIFATDELKNYTPGDWLDIANLDVNGIHSTCNTGFICEYDFYCDHEYEAVVTEGNCQTPGYTTYTCTECGDIYTIYDGETSEWSTTKPTGVDENLIETKTQYRYADKETTTSYEANLSGWTKTGSSWQQTGTGSVEYVESWPSGFATSCWLYPLYNNTPKSASETETEKTVITGDNVSGYIYYHWCRGTYTSGPINRGSKDTQQGEYNAFHAFYSTTDPGSLTPASEGDGSYQIPNADHCKDSYWYFYIPVRTQTYTTYRNLFTYERWEAWSDWSDTAYSANTNRKVETRTLYRYVTGGTGDHSYSDGYCTLCGAVDPDYTFITAEISLGDVTGCQGNTITIPVTINDNPGFSGFTFSIQYDTTALTLTNIAKGEVLTASESGSFTKNVSGGVVTWTDIENLTGDGVLLELTFTILEDAEVGSYDISIGLKDGQSTNFVDENARAVQVEFIGGTVSVTEPAPVITLIKIELATAPSKIVYQIGESLDTTGLTLKATYSDGSIETITSGFTTSGFDSSTAGTKTVTVSYEGKTTSFTVTVEESDDDEGMIELKVSTGYGGVGSIVEMEISISNVPENGISSLDLSVEYDPEQVKLVSVPEDGGILGEYLFGKKITLIPYGLTWNNLENYTPDGVLATIQFEILDMPEDGIITIRVSCNECCDLDEKTYDVETATGVIQNRIPGDVNGDGKVTQLDVTRLRKYLAGGWDVEIDLGAADVNGDGKVTQLDVTRLRKYLAGGWDVTLQ